MKITDIRIGMQVRVSTFDDDDLCEREVGVVLSINPDLLYPIEVDFAGAVVDFKPEDLEEY
ncbi:MAG: hypothetical protein KAW92_10565 [Candidatus Cloacimonetes bacterium]|nr:hypothetical protein [Candidatus Cloacimonadota bacterium]